VGRGKAFRVIGKGRGSYSKILKNDNVSARQSGTEERG